MIGSKIDTLSLATTPVHLLSGGDAVSQGTGFFYVLDHAEGAFAFLVTNYHVLTGVEPGSGKSPEGEVVRFYIHTSDIDPAEVVFMEVAARTSKGTSAWLEHPSLRNADVVAIPIPAELLKGITLNVIGAADHGLLVTPTSPATLIGYPQGLHDEKNRLPVWKTGAVASEPEVDFDGQPLFLVDVAAFAGMSGSPVLATAYGSFMRRDGVTQAGYARQFLGVYASMYMQDENAYLEAIPQGVRLGVRLEQSLQLGCIWKKRIVTEVLGAFDPARHACEVRRIA